MASTDAPTYNPWRDSAEIPNTTASPLPDTNAPRLRGMTPSLHLSTRVTISPSTRSTSATRTPMRHMFTDRQRNSTSIGKEHTKTMSPLHQDHLGQCPTGVHRERGTTTIQVSSRATTSTGDDLLSHYKWHKGVSQSKLFSMLDL
jgi:hypothetical protein